MNSQSAFDPTELDVLRRERNGELVPAADLARLGPVALKIADRVREYNGHADDENWDQALRELLPRQEADAVALALLAGPQPVAPPVDEPPRCPPLPDSVRLDPALGSSAGVWLDRYVRFARAVSPMTPDLFHEGAALWLGSVAIARRLELPMAFSPVYPNLFVAWIAPSTLFRKSTSLDVARRVAWAAVRHLLTPQDSTPEALVADLAGREPGHFEDLPAAQQELWRRRRHFAAARGLVLDEFSGMLASAGRDYMAGVLELYMRTFDCTEQFERITRGQGLVIVRNAYLSLLGASTPSALGPHLAAPQLWGNGWWPRFALLCPPDERPAWRLPTAEPDAGLPADLVTPLCHLDKRLPQPTWPEPPRALQVRLDRAAHEFWQPYSKALTYDLLGDGLDERLHAAYGRLPTQALKVATILAALDWPAQEPVPRIGEAHMARALTITESWRASFHRLLEVNAQTTSNARRGRVIRQVANAGPSGLNLSGLWRRMRDVDVKELEILVEEAVKLGEVEEIPGAAIGPKGGRPPSPRFRIPAGEVLSGDREVSL